MEGQKEAVDSIKDDIFNKAIRYGLISNEEVDERDLLFSICYILCTTKEKANVTP